MLGQFPSWVVVFGTGLYFSTQPSNFPYIGPYWSYPAPCFLVSPISSTHLIFTIWRQLCSFLYSYSICLERIILLDIKSELAENKTFIYAVCMYVHVCVSPMWMCVCVCFCVYHVVYMEVFIFLLAMWVHVCVCTHVCVTHVHVCVCFCVHHLVYMEVLIFLLASWLSVVILLQMIGRETIFIRNKAMRITGYR